MTTNEFERDLNDQAGLKRPGRVDLRVFQNTPDAGDGHPGVQRCFRNYLHEGGMEKDLDVNSKGIINLPSINTITINDIQWGYVGGANQSVKQTDLPTFGGLTVNGNIVITGNVDGVDVSDLKDAFDTHKGSTGSDHTYIDQSVIITASPTFVGLTLSANLVTTSTVDGVDVSSHEHSGAGQGGTVDHVNLLNRDGDSDYLHSTSAEQTNWNSAYSHISSDGDSHNYINQNVTTTGTPTFGSVTCNNATSNFNHIFPNTQHTYNLGEVNKMWNLGFIYTLYYHTLIDNTCADFSEYESDELASLLEWKKREDGILHHDPDSKKYFPHIDFALIPDEFASYHMKDKPYEVKNMPIMVNGKIENKGILKYNKGEKSGITFNTMTYAIKDLVVKMHKKIKKLEKEIELLKSD